MKNAVFILSIFDTGYYVARSLKNGSGLIYGFDHDPGNPGFYSRYIKAFLVPNPLIDSGRLFEILLEKRNEFADKPVLIPASEVYLTFMWQYREELENYFLFAIPGQDILSNILNKSTQFKIAEKVSLLVPVYNIINTPGDLTSVIGSINFPLIIKGIDQATWKSKIKEKAFIVRTSDELQKISAHLFRHEISFIIQQLIIGDIKNNYEFNALVINGRVVMHQVIQKVQQYPVGIGAACCIQTIENKEIELLGIKFVENNDIEGLSNTEFKYDELSGKYYFIETNARAWQQVELAKSIEDNFIVNYYNLLAGKTMENNRLSKTGLIWVDYPAYLLLFLKYRHLIKFTFAEFLKTTLCAKKYGLFCLQDIKPFLHDLKIINRN